MSDLEFDPRLYLVVDSMVSDECVSNAVEGGVTLVQLRDKAGTTRSRIARARQLVALLAPSGVPLFINDRIDIALASGAHGVHVGQEDMTVADARRIMPPNMALGLTVRTEDEAREADVDAVDYLSIGGVYPTTSKNNTTPPLGPKGLTDLAGHLRGRGAQCLTAIAGITADNVAEVMQCGVDGVAVVSAITQANAPRDAAQQLRSLIDASQS